MKKPIIRARGIRFPIPKGYVLARSDAGHGPVSPHKVGKNLSIDKQKTLNANLLLTGDVTTTADGVATVIGLDTIPLNLSPLTDTFVITYDLASGKFILAAGSGGGGSLTVTDGTHTVSGATQITFTGATVGGTTPNATVTVSGGGGSTDPYEGNRNAGSLPHVADFTWVNQGSSTATDTTDGIAFVPQLTAGNGINYMVKAPPTAPYSVYVRLAWESYAINYNKAALIIGNSTSARFCLFGTYHDSGVRYLTEVQYTAPGSISAQPLKASWIDQGGGMWLRADVTSTQLTFFVSPDGYAPWRQVATETLASFLNAGGGTVDRIGFGGESPQDSTNFASVKLGYFDTSAPT